MTEGIIATLIGGLLALAGAFIGPFLQRKHDRWLAQRADEGLLRDKAEQLFQELDRIQAQSRLSMSSILASVKNPLTEIVPMPDLGRVRAIISVYFPTASPIVKALENLKDSKGKVFMDYVLEQAKNNDLTENRTNGLQLFLVSDHSANLANFVAKLRSHVSEIVPRV
jgi:hypothetical protein